MKPLSVAAVAILIAGPVQAADAESAKANLASEFAECAAFYAIMAAGYA